MARPSDPHAKSRLLEAAERVFSEKGLDRAKGVGMRLYIEAGGDIDQAAAQARAAGLTLAKEPHDTEWGARAFDVTEPSGFVLTIASPAVTR